MPELITPLFPISIHVFTLKPQHESLSYLTENTQKSAKHGLKNIYI